MCFSTGEVSPLPTHSGNVSIQFLDRRFEWWAYSVSMGRLLLRSPKAGELPRVDILFQAARDARISSVYEGLHVSNGPRDDQFSEEIAGIALQGSESVFRLVSRSGSGFVIASAVSSISDDGEFFEPSALWPTGPTVGA